MALISALIFEESSQSTPKLTESLQNVRGFMFALVLYVTSSFLSHLLVQSKDAVTEVAKRLAVLQAECGLDVTATVRQLELIRGRGKRLRCRDEFSFDTILSEL